MLVSNAFLGRCKLGPSNGRNQISSYLKLNTGGGNKPPGQKISTVNDFPDGPQLKQKIGLNNIAPFYKHIVAANIRSGDPLEHTLEASHHEIKPFRNYHAIKFFEKAQTELQIKEFKTLKELFTYFHQTITEGLKTHDVVSNAKLEKIFAEKAWKLIYPNEKIPANLSPRDILKRIPIGAWVKALDNNMPPELEQLMESSGYAGEEAETMFLSNNTSISLSGSAQKLADNKQFRELLKLYSFLGSANSSLNGILGTAKRNGFPEEFKDYKFIESTNIP